MSSVRKKSKDLLLVKGPTEDGAGVHVVRARPERLELGTMRPLEDGRPLDGEVVRVSGPHPDCPFLYEVETEFSTSEATAPAAPAPAKKASPAPAATGTATERSAGPPQVASAAYRRNWDAIWNRPTKRGPVLN
jgi:hypothetical protein